MGVYETNQKSKDILLCINFFVFSCKFGKLYILYTIYKKWKLEKG